MGQTMLCIVKTASLSSTVRILVSSGSLAKPDLNRKVKTSSADKADKLKTYKVCSLIESYCFGSHSAQEFYLPAELYSVHFLKSKLCVGGSTGFQVVDLETLDTQVLLDPADNALSFMKQYKNPCPLGVYRIKGDFLVCYRGSFSFSSA
jgi:hypothetical protein